ncbi:MAG: hypothetical protein AB8G05_28110 [Oligoflexales bacterium]
MTLNSSIQKDVFEKSVTEQIFQNNKVTEEAQKELEGLLKEKGWFGWLKGDRDLRKKVERWQGKYGSPISMEKIEEAAKEKLKNVPQEAGETAKKFGASSLTTIKTGAKYYSSELASFAATNPKALCLYVGGCAVGFGVVVGGVYLYTCNDECIINPPEEDDLITLINIYDGSVYGIQLGVSYQNTGR